MKPTEHDVFTEYCEKTVEEIENTKNASEEANPPAATLPPCHRVLAPSEALRRDDKGLRNDTQEWERIPDRMRGTIATSSSGDYAAYCRPMPPEANVWYVSKDGAPDAFGTPDDPFDTLRTARQKIEKDCQQVGVEPCGLIVDFELNVLFAYDLPEPEAVPEENDNDNEELRIPDGYLALKPATKIRETDYVASSTESGKEWIPAGHLAGKLAKGYQVIRKRKKQDPHRNKREEVPEGFRLRDSNEIIERKDKIWTEEGRWVQAENSVGDEVGDRRVCRKTPKSAFTEEERDELRELTIAVKVVGEELRKLRITFSGNIETFPDQQFPG